MSSDNTAQMLTSIFSTFSRLKLAIKKNGLGMGHQHLQDLVSSLNNQSSSVTGAGTASERLLGFRPRFNLSLVSKYMTSCQREDMLTSLRANKYKGSRKIRNVKNKDFYEGQRFRLYDHQTKRYNQFGLVTGHHPSSDGLIQS